MSQPLTNPALTFPASPSSPIPDSPSQPASAEALTASPPQLSSPELMTRSEDTGVVRMGIKRPYSEIDGETFGAAQLPSTPPTLKRLRRQDPQGPQNSNTTADQPSKQIHQVDDGRQRIAVEPVLDSALEPALASPSVSSEISLAAEIASFCLSHEKRQRNETFPGWQTFTETSATQFAHLLDAASVANHPGLVRALLNTGLGDEAGDVLRTTVQRTHVSGGLQAIDAITDTRAYWIQGIDQTIQQKCPESTIVIGNAERPPYDWQAGIRQELTPEQRLALRDSFQIGDIDAVTDLLFLPGHRPESGRFSLRMMRLTRQADIELLMTSGAVILSDAPSFSPSMVMYSTDFNTSHLHSQLLIRPMTESLLNTFSHHTPFMRVPILDELDINRQRITFAASWGDLNLFQKLWQNETDATRERLIEHVLTNAACAGANWIISAALPNARPPTPEHIEYLTEALKFAAASGQTATCAFLIQIGAKLNSPNDECPSLLIALQNREVKTSRMLVHAGAHVGKVAMGLAARIGQIELYELLQQHHTPVNPAPDLNRQDWPLHEQDEINNFPPPVVHAIESKQRAMLDYLMTREIDINARFNHGRTPLMYFSEIGNTEAVQMLLDHGAEVWHDNDDGQNAIDLAILSSSLPTLQRLLAAPINKIAPARWFQSLVLAIPKESPGMITALLPFVKIRATYISDMEDDSPLLQIRYRAHLPEARQPEARHAVLSMLLNLSDMPLNRTTASGMSALMVAVNSMDALAVEQLVQTRMDLGLQTVNKESAFTFALDNIGQTADFVSEDLATWSKTDDRFESGSAILAGRILRSLCGALVRRPDQYALLVDDWLTEEDPIKRDLALFLMYAQSESMADITRVLAQEDTMARLVRRELLNLPAGVMETKLASVLMAMGVPSALHTRLLPSLGALTQVLPRLFVTRLDRDRAFANAVDGLYFTLDAERRDLADQAAAYYDAQESIDTWWKTTLTSMTRQWLNGRIDRAIQRERDEIAPVFADLFKHCAAVAMTNEGQSMAWYAAPPEPGTVANMLGKAGIYADLANSIDAAWRFACHQIRTLPIHDTRTQTADELGKLAREIFYGTLVASVDDAATTDGPTIIQTINTADTEDTEHSADQLYATLMSRQLRLLKQALLPTIESTPPGI